MKLKLSIVLLFFFIGISATNAQKINTGIEGGIGITNLQDYHNIYKQATIKPSFSLNYYLNYELNHLFSVSVEPGFITKRKFIEGTSINLQIPLSLEYKISEKFHLFAGLECGYRLTDDDFYNLTRFDIGMQTGAYYTFNNNIDVGIKGGSSFLGIFKDNTIILTDEEGNPLGEEKWNLYPYYAHFFLRYRF